MKINFKVLQLSGELSEEQLELKGEPAVSEYTVELIVKDDAIEAIWVGPDYEEMYIYIKGHKFVLDYDREMYIEISKLLGEDVNPKITDNGLT